MGAYTPMSQSEFPVNSTLKKHKILSKDSEKVVDDHVGVAKMLNLFASKCTGNTRVWNLDSDLEAGKKLLAKEIGMNTIVSIKRAPKVRGELRGADEDSYTPHRVPIGPYHHNCSSSWIAKEKLRYVGFMQSVSERYKADGLNGLVEELEPRAREWYGDGVDHMTPEELARMLLHDGCYLLGWLVNYPDAPQTSCNDHNTVFRDILYLIENQLPFFVLDKIHARATGGSSCLLHYMATYIQSLLHAQLYISQGKQRLMEQPWHLLHLVHEYFRPANLPKSTDPQQTGRTGRWRRATAYRLHAKVRFMPRDFAAEVNSVLDVRLEGGTLWVPRLQVCRDTWTLLRNLMALEEQMPKRPVTAYCIFMSQVACTVEDVRLLVDAKIVQHFEGSDEHAAQGFADLCKGVVMDVDNIDRNYLKPIWRDLEKRHKSRAHNFWGGHSQRVAIALALLVVVVLLACVVTQTFYVIIGYRQQTKH
ncbi:unnamed protein product [Triticum turgidum subsp. durum]|uniref:Uncharacterized protein n=1 Tax=Triticum turgidum subsp. durum TaxID=4567 RepID=A0A9R0UT80_TRITD|nr:unnamed protein product [Triticum turgidum subsp. durum]